jgi:hypothetical protein
MPEQNSPTERPVETVWAERLAEFKTQEKPEAVLLLAEDPELSRITVAWTNTSTARPKKFTRPPQGDDSHEWWEWLWQNRVYSRQEVMEKASYSELRFDKKFRALVGNRAIYPDGTVNSFVQRYLREKVLKLFQTKPARAGAKKE